MKTSRPASFWPPLTMPNSAACLIELIVSPPALARPMTLAPDACACSRNDEKSERIERGAHAAEHLAAIGLDDIRDVAFERVAEGVIGGQEEPGVAAGLDHRRAGAVGQRRGVIDPVHRVRVAQFAGNVRRGRIGRQINLVLLAGDAHRRDRRRRGAGAEDNVDLVDVVPAAGGRTATSGLFCTSAWTSSTGLPSTLPPMSSIAICVATTAPWPLMSE